MGITNIHHDNLIKRIVDFISNVPIRWIIGIAIILRLIVCIIYISTAPTEIHSLTDNYQNSGTDGHIQIARTLFLTARYAYEDGGALVHNRPPVHPIVMLIFGAWSMDYWYYIWIGFTILLCVPGILLIQLTLKNFQVSGKNITFACWFYALHPWLILSCRTTTFVPETIILLQLLTYYYFHPKTKIYQTQIIAALLVLTHGSFIFLPLLIQIGYYCRNIQATKALLVSICMVSVWTIRNYSAFGQFIPVVTGGGIQYWKGEESVFTEKKDIYIHVFEKETGHKPNIKFFGTVKPEDDKIYASLAWKHITENPFHFFKRTLHGYWYFWAPHENFPLKAWLSGIPNFILLFLIAYFTIMNGFKSPTIHFWIFIFCINTIFALLVPHASYFPMLLGVSITFLCASMTKSKIIQTI